MPGAKHARTVMTIVAIIVVLGLVGGMMLGMGTTAPAR
jgi:hypothetical protein